MGSSASNILLGGNACSTTTTTGVNYGGADDKDGKGRGIGRNRTGPGLTLPTCSTTDNKGSFRNPYLLNVPYLMSLMYMTVCDWMF